MPLLEVNIPIHAPGQTNLVAAAQLILDGRGIGQEFAALDRHLLAQAAGAFLVSAIIVVVTLLWAFGRLRRIQRRLEEQATTLRRANQELALAAKTSAVGAVTAHLIHGLTNPLFGLRNYVVARAGGDASPALHAGGKG